MITASLAWPTKADARAVTASKTSSGERSWRASTGRARARCDRTAFGPAVCSLRCASSSGRPPGPLPSRSITSVTESAAAAAAVSGDGEAEPSLRLGTTTVTDTSLEHGFPPCSGPRGTPGQGLTSRPRLTFSPGAGRRGVRSGA